MKLTNEDFARDMQLAREGKADVEKLIRKWGPRGGAFYGFLNWSK